MTGVKYTEISSDEAGQRLDNYLLRQLKGVPKSFIYRIVRSGEVRVNKKRAKPTTRVQSGDVIRIPPVKTSTSAAPVIGQGLEQVLKHAIIFENEQLIVMNKPSGLAVHGGSGFNVGVIEALRKLRTDIKYMELVHRLDRETSGCLLIAKKRSVLKDIQKQLTERTVQKTYWALLNGRWLEKSEKVTVDLALEKNTLQSGERMVVGSDEGKKSLTRFILLENYSDACLVKALPKTGRTHQIRVHAAHLDHPIAGDEKYGGKAPFQHGAQKKGRLYLHARKIQFTLNNEVVEFQAEIDERFSQTLKQLQMRSSASHE